MTKPVKTCNNQSMNGIPQEIYVEKEESRKRFEFNKNLSKPTLNNNSNGSFFDCPDNVSLYFKTH